ncbi:MAG: TonB-dependent receptor plug domain-containing protein, partial [Cellvibrio sp.]
MSTLSLSFVYTAFLTSTITFSQISAAQTQSPQDSASETKRLGTVKVSADAEVANGPVEGYHAKNSATGTKTDTPLLDTPVSVQVISRSVMDDQQVLTIADATKNVSGVYIKHGPDGNTMDSFSIRGFELDHYGATYLDGAKDFSRAPKETAGLERIEILKGPAAIMYGRIEPGGMINRVSKRPQAESLTTLQQQIGSHNYFRTTLDSTGTLTSDGAWLYRVNIAGEDTDGFVDDTHNRRTYVAPQIEWLANDSTSIRTGFEYQKNDRSWALTYGTIGDANGPVKIPRSTNFHDKDDKYKDDSLSWKLEWEHHFNDDWKLQQRISYVDRNSVAKGSGLSEILDTDGNYSRTYWGWKDEQAKTAATNIDLIGKFSTGAITHTLLIGGDYFDEDYDSGGWQFNGTELISNIYHPNNTDAPYDNDHVVLPFGFKNQHKGFYIQDQMAALDERLHIMIGARYDKARATYLFADAPEIT